MYTVTSISVQYSLKMQFDQVAHKLRLVYKCWYVEKLKQFNLKLLNLGPTYKTELCTTYHFNIWQHYRRTLSEKEVLFHKNSVSLFRYPHTDKKWWRRNKCTSGKQGVK